MNQITVQSHLHFKLGLIARPLKPRALLHFDDIKRYTGLVPSAAALQSYDYSTGMPDNLGVLGNDTLGDCTAAGKYHMFQVTWFVVTGQYISGALLTGLAEKFYAGSTGYDPAAALVPDPNNAGSFVNPTDQGGDMDAVAKFLMTNGMPLPGDKNEKIVAAFDVSPQNISDMAHCGQECLGIDFGVIVTDKIMPTDGSAIPSVWSAGGNELGGHDTYSIGFNAQTGSFKHNSWGMWFWDDTSFMQNNVSQAVCYVRASALKDGKTVLGMDQQTWENAVKVQATPVV